MVESRPITILCIATFEKGADFLRECRRQGCRVLLLTSQSLAKAGWPWDSIDDIFYLPDGAQRDDIVKGVSYMAQHQSIDRIVPLDDYDVETAALLREHLRIPGMGETTARYFRDKLAMRVKAREAGLLVPDFVHVLNRDALREFTRQVPPLWVLKPRSEASTIGIKMVNGPDELWPLIDELGDRRSFYVLEKYIPGDIFHIDSIVSEREIVFSAAHRYGHPPMEVAHHGGIFTTRKLHRDSSEAQVLRMLNRELISALGLVRGVTHTEFIRSEDDGRYFFLETSARAGGAHIVEVIEAATGINLWTEWARIEIDGGARGYRLPAHREDFAGIVISLARQESPDTTAYNDPEIVWRLKKKHHAGLIVASEDPKRVDELLEAYSTRFRVDFFASQPLPHKPTS